MLFRSFGYLRVAFLRVLSFALSLCQAGWLSVVLTCRSLLTLLSEGERKGGGLAGLEETPMAEPDPTANDVTDTVESSETSLFTHMKQMFGVAFRFAKDIIQKLIFIPRIVMFMPMDQILDPGLYAAFDPEQYNDGRGKIHNKSSLKLLFHEGDIGWIMTMIFYSEHADAKPLFYFSAIGGAAFGSIHCAAWNFEFPSHVEQMMWRTASLTLVGVCLSIFIGMRIQNWADPHYERAKVGSLAERLWSLLVFREYIWFFPTIIYPITRFTLLFLALLSLRHIPDSALRTVTWTKFIPHI